MFNKSILKNPTSSIVFSTKQKTIEQETQRANMVRYLDMVTIEKLRKAGILTKISTE